RGCTSNPLYCLGCSSLITPTDLRSLTVSSGSRPSRSAAAACSRNRSAIAITLSRTRSAMLCPCLSALGASQQEAQHGVFKCRLRLDHRQVPAVGEHVQLGIGPRAHRDQCHVEW